MKINQILTITFLLLTIGQITAQNTYHVAKSGNDANNGSENTPFLTIGKAASILQAGDKVIINQGVYRETVTPTNSGTAGLPIIFEAKQGDTVIISGMNAMDNWSLEPDGTYRTTMNWTLGDENMVMFDGHLCDLARWPNNVDGDPFTIDAATSGTGNLTQFSDTFPNHDWTNGVFWYLGNSRWTSWRADITSSSAGQITFQGPSGWEGSAHNPANGGEYYLSGAKAALDYEYEFYYDNDSNYLYLKTPNNTMPQIGQVEIKQRHIGMELTNKNHIIVDGIEFYGCSINIFGSASNNIIRNCKVFWGNHTVGSNSAAIVNQRSITLFGNNNLVEKCEVAWGASSGIWVAGSNNTVQDCLVHDFNYLASYASPIHIRSGDNAKIIQNTIYNGGRDNIQVFGEYHEVAYNDSWASNLISDDCGIIYTCCGTNYSEIHHNYFHDIDSRGSHYKAAGIYLDNDAKEWSVHHNVIQNMEWTGIQINKDNWYMQLYNNTIWNTSEAMGRWQPTGTSMNDVHTFNNLSHENTYYGTTVENNLMAFTSPFLDINNQDFRLQSGNNAIDYGKTVSGINIPFTGNSPDAGALESGMPPFWVGVTWLNPVFPDGEIVNTTEIQTIQLTIFPNPATDFVQIEGEIEANTNLYIFSSTGQLMLEQTDFKQGQIDIHSLKSGAYFLYLRKGNEVKVGRFLKF